MSTTTTTAAPTNDFANRFQVQHTNDVESKTWYLVDSFATLECAKAIADRIEVARIWDMSTLTLVHKVGY